MLSKTWVELNLNSYRKWRKKVANLSILAPFWRYFRGFQSRLVPTIQHKIQKIQHRTLVQYLYFTVRINLIDIKLKFISKMTFESGELVGDAVFFFRGFQIRLTTRIQHQFHISTARNCNSPSPLQSLKNRSGIKLEFHLKNDW